MDKKAWLGCSLALIALLVTQPIWYYLLYQVLVRVEASDLMWFLYWVYVPVSILASVIAKFFEYAVNGKAG
jgi:hypothetical protein